MKMQIAQGIQVALITYNILRKHLKLLAYITLPTTTHFLLDTFAPMHQATYIYNLLHPVLIVWFGVALVRHIHHIIKYNDESWASSIADTVMRTMPILIWGVVASFVIGISYAGKSLLYMIGLKSSIITLPFMVLWIILTAFIIAIISSEPQPLIPMIKEAFNLMREYAWELAGGLTIFISFLLVPVLLVSFLQLLGLLPWGIVYHATILAVLIVFQTVVIMFCALLHRHYMRKVKQEIVIDIRTLYTP